MRPKITMNRAENKTFEEVFQLFIKSRAAKGVSDTTIRNIQNKEVDLQRKQVIFHHNKNGKIQTMPLVQMHREKQNLLCV